jgi:hypothetical protein
MKYFYLLSFFLLNLNIIFCQEIEGFCVDLNENPIGLANIQLIIVENNQIISYSQTNHEGKFKINTKGKSLPLKLKITHLSFETQEIIIGNLNETKIILEPRTIRLKDVVVESKVFDVVEKNDTLKYNLNNLLNGAELKLKDIIEKLPGVSIDEQGKIRYNGKIIDHLLLDGDEFFGENHQIANENLTSEMIEKIELLKNYQDFSSIKGFENSNQVALNVGLKEKFRENWRGNTELEGGIQNRYQWHNNLFNFGSKNKFNLIANTNNINQSVVSISDFLNTRNHTGRKMILDQFSRGSQNISEKDLPSFLFSEDNVQTKDSKNYTLNWTRKFNEKERIEFISIMNHLKQTENQESLQIFFDDENSIIENNENQRGSSFYSSNLLKYQNKLSDNSYLKINSYLFFENNHQNQHLETLFQSNQEQNIFNNKVKLNNHKLGINAYYKEKISEKFLFEGTIFNDYQDTNSQKNLNSNNNFGWFNFNQNHINQNTDSKQISLGGQGSGTIKINSGTFSVRILSVLDQEKISNDNNMGNDFNLENTFQKIENIIGTKYNTSLFNKKLHFILGLDYVNNQYKMKSVFEENISALLPNVNLSYKINKRINIFGGYEASLNGFSSLQFLTGNMIENYRTLLLRNNLIPKEMISDNYRVGLSFSNTQKNIFSTLSFSHINFKQTIGKTIVNNIESSVEQFNFLNLDQNSFLLYQLDKKFNEIPVGFNLNTTFSKTKKNTFINDIESINENFQNQVDFGIKSYFKKSPFNLKLGISYLINRTENVRLNTSSIGKLDRISPYLNMNGLAFEKKFNWNINANYHIFNANNVSSNEIFDLGFKVIYNHNEKWNYFIHGTNILNIRENNTKNSIMNNPAFFQETILTTLSGFLNFGLIFRY